LPVQKVKDLKRMLPSQFLVIYVDWDGFLDEVE